MRIKLKLPSQERLRELFHYDPDTGIFTRNGKVVGFKRNSGYICISVDNQQFQAHRLAWMYVYGVDPGQTEIDHKDQDKTNNRISNLRLATLAQNRWNTNRKGYRQLSSGSYEVRIQVNKQPITVGYFETEEEAREAYLCAKKELHGDFCPQ